MTTFQGQGEKLASWLSRSLNLAVSLAFPNLYGSAASKGRTSGKHASVFTPSGPDDAGNKNELLHT
jgi:hypothetical protein